MAKGFAKTSIIAACFAIAAITSFIVAML